MTSPILVEQRGAIEILTLNRPDKLNTMNEAMIFALQDYFRGLQKRLDVRVVLFRAEGLYVNLARPPATPANMTLLRCSLCAEHTSEQVDQILGMFEAAGKAVGAI